MTSLVTEVLLQADKLDKEDIQTKVSKLCSYSNEMKEKIFKFVKAKHGEMKQIFTTCPVMLSEIREQQAQAKEIRSSLSGLVKTELQDSTSEFENLSEELSETSELLFAMENLWKLCNLYESQSNSKKNGDYKKSASSLLAIKAILEKVKGTCLVDLQIFQFLKNEYIVIYEDLLYSLDEKWKFEVTWALPDDLGDREEISLKIPYLQLLEETNDKNVVDFKDFLAAMSTVGRLRPKLHKLADWVKKYLLTSLIEDHSLSPDINEENEDGRTRLKISLKKNIAKDLDEVSPVALFQKVLEVLNCLFNNVLCIPLEDNKNSMAIFGECIRDDLLQLLIDKYLVSTVPNTKKELEEYKHVENAVRNFESALTTINFLPENPKKPADKLLLYAMNVSKHFASRRCVDILSQARELIKKGIHNTQTIRLNDMKKFSDAFENSDKYARVKDLPFGTDFDSQKPSKRLSDYTLHFPACEVSECAINIMKLAFQAMKEASEASFECAICLVAATHDIFELYHTTFPMFHEYSLATFPQQAAIFHNDCMYLAHHLITFGHQFSKTSEFAKKTMPILTFIDKVPYLRRLGAETLLCQMKKQKSTMIESLEPILNFSINQNESKQESIKKAVKQVTYQFDYLKKVWSDILPTTITHRALATLLDSCIKDLVGAICGMEDISNDDSITLRESCELMLNHAPSLFQESSDEPNLSWRALVPKWTQLEEIAFVLSSSLKLIVDRWADGKGPLASTLSVFEVKGLIKALFQNTEHRAQAIAKIKP